MKNVFTSKTVWGILISLAGLLSGPDAAGILEPLFGGTLPMWASNVIKVLGLAVALYGRFKATRPLTLGPGDK